MIRSPNVLAALLLAAAASSLGGQPVLVRPEFGQDAVTTGIRNLRVAGQSADGTEVTLVMDVTYDGLMGPSANVLPVIQKRDNRAVSGWFGADPATVGRGRATASVQVRFFNDEPGVPAEATTDFVTVYLLQDGGHAVITGNVFPKSIKWGRPDARPKTFSPPQPRGAVDPERARRQAAEAAAAEAKAKEEVRRAADAEAKAKAEAEAREKARAQAEADARIREEARQKAEMEGRRLAEEKRLAEQRAEAEARAREEARLKADAEVKRLAEEKRLADEKAKVDSEQRNRERLAAEAKAREESRLKAEAEVKRLAEERLKAEKQAAAEARAREEARLKAEVEAARLAEEKRLAQEKARQETEGRRLAEERARSEADARVKAETEAKAREQARLEAEKRASEPAAPEAPVVIATSLKTRITNVDIVNRSLDRSQMTVGVEFDYRDNFGPRAMLGVDVTHSRDSRVSGYFVSNPTEIGRAKRSFLLFPVKFQPPPQSPLTSLATDRILVYLLETAGGNRSVLLPVNMILAWRSPGARAPEAETTPPASVEIQSFKQNDLHTGYVTVKYDLGSGSGRFRTRVFDSKVPESAERFVSPEVQVNAGTGLQILQVAVRSDTGAAGMVFSADTVEVDLLDAAGRSLAKARAQIEANWSRPKP